MPLGATSRAGAGGFDDRELIRYARPPGRQRSSSRSCATSFAGADFVSRLIRCASAAAPGPCLVALIEAISASAPQT